MRQTEFADPDPLSNRFDLGKDPLEFARSRAELVAQVMPLIAERLTKGDAKEGTPGYQRVRQAFGVLLSAHGQAMFMASTAHRRPVGVAKPQGRSAGPAPFTVVDGATAAGCIGPARSRQMFAAGPFTYPPGLLDQLAATKWMHWAHGRWTAMITPSTTCVAARGRIAYSAGCSIRLTPARIRDSEPKVPADQDAFTTAELLERPRPRSSPRRQTSGPAAIHQPEACHRQPAGGLQRALVTRLAGLAVWVGQSLPDAQARARMQLVAHRMSGSARCSPNRT